MTTYSVHYGTGHLSRCAVDPRNYRTFGTARRAALRYARDCDHVVIADTDGSTWTIRQPSAVGCTA